MEKMPIKLGKEWETEGKQKEGKERNITVITEMTDRQTDRQTDRPTDRQTDKFRTLRIL